jgi:peptidoglycan/xylan/chitin deacetylase (PgdA/CDA1 family)
VTAPSGRREGRRASASPWAVLAAGGAAAGAGVWWLARTQPPRLARLLGHQGVALISVLSRSPTIAITLDDGPHETLTPEVLEVLERHGARATFFFLGSAVASNPDVVAATIAAGHEIGNHGWRDRPALLMSRKTFRRDSRRAAAAIREVTGTEPRFMRPGSGWFRPGHLREVRHAGWALALGSVAVLDLRVRDVTREVRFVVDRLQPGAVVVLHEGRADRAAVVPLLDAVLTAARQLGYRAVTLSDLLRDAAGPHRPSTSGPRSSS